MMDRRTFFQYIAAAFATRQAVAATPEPGEQPAPVPLGASVVGHVKDGPIVAHVRSTQAMSFRCDPIDISSHSELSLGSGFRHFLPGPIEAEIKFEPNPDVFSALASQRPVRLDTVIRGVRYEAEGSVDTLSPIDRPTEMVMRVKRLWIDGKETVFPKRPLGRWRDILPPADSKTYTIDELDESDDYDDPDDEDE